MAAELLMTPARATDANGAPYSGAIWYFYETGGLTPQAVYADADLSTSLGATVTADSGGKFVPIYFDPSLIYRGILKNSTGSVTICDIDPINYSGGAGFFAGRATAVAGSYAKVNWQIEPSSTSYPTDALAGLWSDKVTWDHTISADFTSANAPVNSALQSPAATFMVASHNISSDATVCSLQTISGVHANSKEATGVNFITYSGENLTNVKLKGLEIDIQPHSTTTISEAFGIALNAFTKAIPGPAIYIEGVFGGSWSTGITVGALSNIGAGISPAGGTPSMGSLVDTGTATYAIAAINVSNTHRIRWNGASGNPGYMYVDATNFLRITAPAAGVVFRNNADTTSLTFIDPSNGSVDIQGGGAFKVANTQVVGARDTGWTAMTGTANESTAYDTATVTLAQLAGRVMALQTALTTHGLIGA